MASTYRMEGNFGRIKFGELQYGACPVQLNFKSSETCVLTYTISASLIVSDEGVNRQLTCFI